MKHLSLISYFILFVLSVNAKNESPEVKGVISGKVIDAVTKLPVDYATVSIYKQGNPSPFNGGSTDQNGDFKIGNISPGDYVVTVDFLGYKQLKLAHVITTGTNANALLGQLLLTPLAKQLNEVNITAHAASVENKIDKLVYNPANDLTAQGGTATDVLKKVPMISVDIDGNVDLMGNTNIRFLINGKPSTIFGASITDALASIPASQIKTIEVITSPGAKYDAEGTGGIINIVLKESNIQGINGNINLTAGTRLENGNLNINAKKGKLGVNMFFNGRGQLASTTLNSSNRTSYSNTRDTITNLMQNGTSSQSRSGFQTGISFNWEASKKDNLTASFNFNHFGFSNAGGTNQYLSTVDNLNSIKTNVNSLNNSSNHFSNSTIDWSLAYKKTFNKKDQELDILYNASFGSNTNNYTQQTNYINSTYPTLGSIGNNPGNDKETDISIDYSQPLTEDWSLETGAKLSIEDLTNSSVIQTLGSNGYKPDSNQTYSFNYKRQIYAYYLSTSGSLFNHFIDGKAGLRYEYTTSTSNFPNTNIPSYGILVPSFVLSHKFDKTQSLKFSYSFRLQRPDYRALNPFYNVSDPLNINTGDPNVKPELGHNYELGYNHSFDKGANIYVAAFYRYNTNDLQGYTKFYDTLIVGNKIYTNVSLTKSTNIGKEVDEGINLYGSLPVNGKLSLRSNMFFADRTTYNPGNPDVSGFVYRINLNTSYEFTKDFAAEFFINYRSSQKTIQGSQPAFYFYDLGMRKQFMKKKLSIGLTASSAFNKYANFYSTQYGANFYQTSLRQVPRQSFGINLTYKFGKLEFKKEREKDDSGGGGAPDDGGGK